MSKTFTTTGACFPEDNYMVNIDKRLEEIKKMIDRGDYFAINRARQYGKTTTLRALRRFLRKDYYVVSLDFQFIPAQDFTDENTFALAFAYDFLTGLEEAGFIENEKIREVTGKMRSCIENRDKIYGLKMLFIDLSRLCRLSDKPIVLLIDEVDQASNSQIFFDFLALLRAYYLNRDLKPTFRSVILAGVYDIKNLKSKIRAEKEHKPNSPWNVAADFDIDMSFSTEEIAGMLVDYEKDHKTGMNIDEIAGLLFDYTSGYPFLVSRLCLIMDTKLKGFSSKAAAWTKEGLLEAVKILLEEDNMLFASLMEKLATYPELDDILRTILFAGQSIPYDVDNHSMDIASMFGFIKNKNGKVAIANRIFETRLYNRYLLKFDMQKLELPKAAANDINQFITEGRLNMRRILERFVVHFNDLYGDKEDKFIEERGRELFLLYLKPIINGVGNYYIEAETRTSRRTDVIVDFRGEQFIIEMKIWHGKEYNDRGEKQLAGYLDDYHVDMGYMLSFNFNKNKEIGVKEIAVGDKKIIEAVV